MKSDAINSVLFDTILQPEKPNLKLKASDPTILDTKGLKKDFRDLMFIVVLSMNRKQNI